MRNYFVYHFVIIDRHSLIHQTKVNKFLITIDDIAMHDNFLDHYE